MIIGVSTNGKLALKKLEKWFAMRGKKLETVSHSWMAGIKDKRLYNINKNFDVSKELDKIKREDNTNDSAVACATVQGLHTKRGQAKSHATTVPAWTFQSEKYLNDNMKP